MTKRLKLRGWIMPILVAGLLIPGFLGALIAGPGLGVLFAEAAVFGLVIYSALQRPDEPIEVAASPDDRRRILVLTTADIAGDPWAIEQLAAAVAPAEGMDDPEVLVLAPARSGALSEWLSDVEPGRDRAQVRLVHSVAALAAAGVAAEARVGDADPLQAVEDTLRSFSVGEVVAVTGAPDEDRAGTKAVAEMERRLQVPLLHVVSADATSRARA